MQISAGASAAINLYCGGGDNCTTALLSLAANAACNAEDDVDAICAETACLTLYSAIALSCDPSVSQTTRPL